MKTYMMTYGDDKYKHQKVFLKNNALASGFFDHVRVFGPDDLPPGFRRDFWKILQCDKGGGYWIWKPYLISRMFSLLKHGDVLVYCDAGCEINKHGRKRFYEYLEMLKDSENGSLAFQLPHKETAYTKREVFNYFDCKNEVIYSDQLMATVIILEKCDHASFLVEKWYGTLQEQPDLFTDEKDTIIQHKDFIAHRHDQSIFSIIRKTYGTEIIADDTYFLDFDKYGGMSPIWASRKKG